MGERTGFDPGAALVAGEANTEGKLVDLLLTLTGTLPRTCNNAAYTRPTQKSAKKLSKTPRSMNFLPRQTNRLLRIRRQRTPGNHAKREQGARVHERGAAG